MLNLNTPKHRTLVLDTAHLALGNFSAFIDCPCGKMPWSITGASKPINADVICNTCGREYEVRACRVTMTYAPPP